eukprot:TRINITY_DN1417_c0_g1_i16.p3 TRINITY_DN1417_c0_g1~~TRINITY_DN1417_c0_g1_i16.p3  ORF type:complete len:181 (+),score=66.46 TRINITY_DN1417_c0_g1_i16:2-544(+)
MNIQRFHYFFFFSSRRRHTRSCLVSWARRCVQETGDIYISILTYNRKEVAEMEDKPTIFDKIIRKEIPATIVYEDDQALAFRDIAPQAPTHILIIPKTKDGLVGLSNAEERHKAVLGHLMYVVSVIAKQENLSEGFRVVINDGKHGGQTVDHLHIHLFGGSQCTWPPGTTKAQCECSLAD